MNRLTIRSVWIFLLLFVVTVIAADLRGARPTWSDHIDLVIDAREIILRQFVEEPNERELMEAAVDAMVESLDDPHSVYIPPAEMAQWNEQMQGSFSGIGATVEIKNDRIHIIYPFDDSPAARAGVQPGDAVMEIEGTDTLGMDIVEATRRLKGPEGTPVTIRVRHETGEEVNMTITRQAINIPTVRGLFREAIRPGFLLDDRNRIAYLRLDQFTGTSGRDLRDSLIKLKPLNPRGVILDMRFNPGGLLEAAVEISSLFLPAGKTVVSVKGRTTREVIRLSENGNILGDIPIVVLINEASASASEIVAGALKYNDRAHVVGTRSFGKGSVQTLIPFNDNQGAIKITGAYYYLPNGKNLHRKPNATEWGVDPHDGSYVSMNTQELRKMLETRRALDAKRDLELPEAITPAWLRETMADPQLAAAVEAMLGKLNTGQWPVVGSSAAKELTATVARENLERQREQVMEALNRIDAELQKLDSRGETATQPSTQPATQPTTRGTAPQTQPQTKPAPRTQPRPQPQPQPQPQPEPELEPALP